ncbi:MAG TPA: hypothetical protein IGS52_24375 [Oscillatoriaceae cyanobacterium M33_DOE_052]|uniref:Uncharacterized protein n=1 Tax=Planktothricoides sp. SpSt-374 TaxID=2282167 RepID=A0A7C3ZV51_9CYAN|nr:hypothetical protein [Oscillatoriaceae cyanobacterium M33_DOE_052]
MDVSQLALSTIKILQAISDKALDGALGKIGSDLVDFLNKKFQGRFQIKGAKPEVLEAEILREAQGDNKFCEELERLVREYHHRERESNSPNISQSGVNISVNNNTGKVTGQEINNFFRHKHW